MTLASKHRRDILARMEALSLSRSELARRAGVNRLSLGNFLNDRQSDGTGNPSLAWLDRVYGALKQRRKRA